MWLPNFQLSQLFLEMPEKPKTEAEGCAASDSASNEIVDQVRRQEDLTLTDHVNRRLLTSLLTRINSGDPIVSDSQQTEQPSDAAGTKLDCDDFSA